jgi:hypothetical protein
VLHSWLLLTSTFCSFGFLSFLAFDCMFAKVLQLMNMNPTPNGDLTDCDVQPVDLVGIDGADASNDAEEAMTSSSDEEGHSHAEPCTISGEAENTGTTPTSPIAAVPAVSSLPTAASSSSAASSSLATSSNGHLMSSVEEEKLKALKTASIERVKACTNGAELKAVLLTYYEEFEKISTKTAGKRRHNIFTFVNKILQISGSGLEFKGMETRMLLRRCLNRYVYRGIYTD